MESVSRHRFTQRVEQLLLDVELFERHDTDPAAAFLAGLRDKHNLTLAEFLVDEFGY